MPANLQSRLRTLLPENYQAREATPTPMGSAPLKFGPDGKVLWNEIWTTFCDLALAGGPPHRGTLLRPEPGAPAEVLQELQRGIELVTSLCTATTPGWIMLFCPSAAMAGWLTRAIAMENIATRVDGLAVFLPTGPHYRVEKEIKNVITAVAKTTHSWQDHTDPQRQQAIADLLREMNSESPLLQPTLISPTWQTLPCADVSTAVRTQQTLAALNVLTHREVATLLLPVNRITDPTGEDLTRRLETAQADR